MGRRARVPGRGVVVNVDRQHERETFLASVVVTAVESGSQGIGYWAEVEEYRWWLPDLDGGTAEPGPHGGGNAWATIAEYDEHGRRFDLTPKTISEAYKVLGRGRKGRGLPDYAWPSQESLQRLWDARAENDAGLLDAIDADVLVQLGVYGKLVWG